MESNGLLEMIMNYYGLLRQLGLLRIITDDYDYYGLCGLQWATRTLTTAKVFSGLVGVLGTTRTIRDEYDKSDCWEKYGLL